MTTGRPIGAYWRAAQGFLAAIEGFPTWSSGSICEYDDGERMLVSVPSPIAVDELRKLVPQIEAMIGRRLLITRRPRGKGLTRARRLAWADKLVNGALTQEVIRTSNRE